MIRLLVGFIFSFIIAFLAFKKKSLNLSGFAGAVILGTSLYFFGGVFLSGIMISFFISSSILTKYKEREKAIFEDINEKTGGRDYTQVIANGGLGLIYAFLYYLTKNAIFIVAYTASFAAANADTWSSEVGILSKRRTLSIVTLKRTEAGISGGISLLGTAAGFCGSVFISFIFFIGYIVTAGWNDRLIFYSAIICLTGFSGTIIDSYLGALAQAKYKCAVCGKVTERRSHHNKATIHISGIRLIDNDTVNFISCLLASVIAILFA
jgi:uncharacterized protein (TIGR00297 family)